jgi:ATP-dependent Lon protease
MHVFALALSTSYRIFLSGYTYDEKMHIARRFLLPKQLGANGLDPERLNLTQPALLQIATRYTREAGVRSLERAIGAVVRVKAVEWADHVDEQTENEYRRDILPEDLERILGIARWDGEEKDREERRGIVYGLVVMGQGEGGILPVETIATPGTGQLKLTGSLGEVCVVFHFGTSVVVDCRGLFKVIRESGEIALSWVKTHAYALCVTSLPSQDPLKVPDPIDIHLHLPSGAQKKDGPSAGVTMVRAWLQFLFAVLTPLCYD